MDSLGKIVEILLATILLFVFPLYYMAMKQEAICQTYVTAQTAYLVDSSRNIGYLSKPMYLTYLKKLQETNLVYDIEIIHYRKTVQLIPDEENEILEDPELEGTGLDDEYESSDMEHYDRFYYAVYEDEILAEVLESEEGKYYFQQGDFFLVKLSNRNKTYATKIQEMIFRKALPVEQIIVVYGGAVKDEAK